MYGPTLKKIESAAPFLASKAAPASRPYLDEPYQFALNILEAMSDGQPRTCQQISDLLATKPHHQSINQILMALKRGGIIFLQSAGNPVARSWSLPKGRVTLQERKGD